MGEYWDEMFARIQAIVSGRIDRLVNRILQNILIAHDAAKIASAIVQAVIPWWILVIQFLTTWELIGGLLIIGLLYPISKYKLPS